MWPYRGRLSVSVAALTALPLSVNRIVLDAESMSVILERIVPDAAGKAIDEAAAKAKQGRAGAALGIAAIVSAAPELAPFRVHLAVLAVALIALGYKQVDAHNAVRQAQTTLGEQATVEDLVRTCLKKGG